MSGFEEQPKGKSPYAKKNKRPFKYSHAYEVWKSTGDTRLHDREFIQPLINEQRKEGRRYEHTTDNNA